MSHYWDKFTDSIVTEVEDIAPPERYIRLHKGPNDSLYIETWYVGGRRYLSFSYSQFDKDGELVDRIRHFYAKENDVDLLYMTDWTVPEDYFNQLLYEFGGDA